MEKLIRVWLGCILPLTSKRKLYHCFPQAGRPSLSQRSITWGSRCYRATTFPIKCLSTPESTPEEPTRNNRRPNGKRWYIKICVHLFLFTFLAVASWSQKVLNKDNNSCNFNLPSSSQKYWASRFVRSFISVMPLSSSLAFFVAA